RYGGHAAARYGRRADGLHGGVLLLRERPEPSGVYRWEDLRPVPVGERSAGGVGRNAQAGVRLPGRGGHLWEEGSAREPEVRADVRAGRGVSQAGDPTHGEARQERCQCEGEMMPGLSDGDLTTMATRELTLFDKTCTIQYPSQANGAQGVVTTWTNRAAGINCALFETRRSA